MRFGMKFLWRSLIAGVVMAVSSLSAQAEPKREHRVCIRPPDVPSAWKMWSYMGNRPSFEATSRAHFDEKTEGMLVYVFDRYAPPTSVRLLPIPYNTLICPPPPAGPKPLKKAKPVPKRKPALKPAPPPQLAPKKVAEKPAAKKKKPVLVTPAAKVVKAPEGRVSHELPNGREVALPKYQPLPPKPKELQPKSDPVLLSAEASGLVLPKTTLVGLVKRDDGGGTNAQGKDARQTLTNMERIAYELAFAAAMANGQFNEDLDKPGSTPHGILGGRNPNGPDSAVVQAAVSILQIASGAVVTQAAKFAIRLEKALAAKQRIVLTSLDDLSEETAELLAKQYHFYLADALVKNGTIGRYSVMRKFTANLRNSYHAHHIFEESKIEKFLKGADPNKFPAVILTLDEHKEITRRLAKETQAGIDTLEQQWAAYKRVYVEHPDWLDAIRPYFDK